jgi:hypothetical protein
MVTMRTEAAEEGGVGSTAHHRSVRSRIISATDRKEKSFFLFIRT